MTIRGAFSDNDMLEVCNGGQTTTEYRSQFATSVIVLRTTRLFTSGFAKVLVLLY